MTYGEKGSEKVEWKWFKGPFPLPRPGAARMAAATYRQALRTAEGTDMPLAKLDAMAAVGDVESAEGSREHMA